MRFSQASTASLGARLRAWTLLITIVLLAAGAPSAQAQSVRSAVHDGYARLVFDWPKSIGFNASIADGRLVVTFDEPMPGTIGGAAINRLSDYVGAPTLSPDRRTVSFPLKRGATLRSFANQRSIVIDLVDERTAAAAPAPGPVAPPGPGVAPAAAPVAPPSTSASGPRVPVRVGRHADYTRLVFDWPRSVNYQVSNEGGRTTISFDQPGQVDVGALRRSLPQSVGSVGSGGAPLAFSMSIPAEARLRHFKNGNSIVVDVLAPPNATPVAGPAVAALPPAAPVPAPASAAATTPPASPPPPAAAATPTPPAPPPAVAAAPPPPPAAPAPAPARALPTDPAVDVAVGITQTPAGLRLRFPFAAVTGAAMFMRGDNAYLVFDRAANLDLAAVRRGAQRLNVEPIAIAQGTAMRLSLPANQNPVISKEGQGWMLTLRTEPRRPTQVAPISVPTGGGGEVTIGIAGGSVPLAVPDPDSGDTLRVVAVTADGVGVDTARQYAQFVVQPSLQGVVVAPRADGVEIRVAANAVAIGSRQGLLLSREGKGGGAGGEVFDFKKWIEPDVDFIETRQLLSRAVTEAEGARRPAARFELAQFFLAHNHPADTVGILELIASDSAALATDPALKALRGAARVMLGQGDAAAADLSDPLLNAEPGVGLWRGAAAALRGQWTEADQTFRAAGAVPAAYPPPLRRHLTLLAAEAALSGGDPARARQILEPLARSDTPTAVRLRGDFLRARAMIAAGDRRGALQILERLAASPDRWARAHGEFMLVEQRLADNSMQPKEAIERLDRLRFAWSGDLLQYNLLRRLGDLQVQHGDMRSGLMRLREALTFFPNGAENAAIQAKMTDTFVGLYDPGLPTSRALPPLTALALYDDFRDLTPPGPRGDQMIQRLADRLVQIDLLDRAADLLDHQIRNRLSGVDKARVGARLAVVQMLDRKFEAAITALDASAQPNLPPELESERRQLRARALSATGNSQAALAQLEKDESREAEQLKSEILAGQGNWAKAAEALRRVASMPGDLDAGRQRVVLNLAIAQARAGDLEGLKKTREEFNERMASGPYKEGFGLVTTSSDKTGKIDEEVLNSRFADLQEFQSFMTNYREKLRSNALSALN